MYNNDRNMVEDLETLQFFYELYSRCAMMFTDFLNENSKRSLASSTIPLQFCYWDNPKIHPVRTEMVRFFLFLGAPEIESIKFCIQFGPPQNSISGSLSESRSLFTFCRLIKV